MTLIEVMMVTWGYCVKYGRAWWAKQRALKLIYSDWVQSYEHLSVMLHAMKAKNPRMHFEYIPKPNIMGSEGRQYFFHTLWTFGQCIKTFKHCCDVLSVDDTFLTGKYEGKMLIAIGINADCQLVPFVFAIAEKENNDSWGWFLHLIWKVVVGPGREICIISDKYAGILNVICEVIPNHTLLHHRWCTRHLAQNIIKCDGIKESLKLLEEVYGQTYKKDLKKTKGTREANK
jgi:hypothetical protein